MRKRPSNFSLPVYIFPISFGCCYLACISLLETLASSGLHAGRSDCSLSLLYLASLLIPQELQYLLKVAERKTVFTRVVR